MSDVPVDDNLSLMDDTIIMWSAVSPSIPGSSVSTMAGDFEVERENLRQSFEDSYPLLPSAEVIEADIELTEQTARLNSFSMVEERSPVEQLVQDTASLSMADKKSSAEESSVTETSETGRAGFKDKLAAIAFSAARRNDVHIPDDIDAAGPMIRQSYLGKLISEKNGHLSVFSKGIPRHRDILDAKDDEPIDKLQERSARLLFNIAFFVHGAEHRFKIFEQNHGPRAAETTYLRFYLSRHCRPNNQLDHLVDMEDLFYATCAKVREMVASITCRLENRFLNAQAKLMIQGRTGCYAHEFTALALLERLCLFYQNLMAGTLHSTLDQTVQDHQDRRLENQHDQPVALIWAFLAEKYHGVLVAEAKAQEQLKLAERSDKDDVASINSVGSSVRAPEEIISHRHDTYRCLTYNEGVRAASDTASEHTVLADGEMEDDHDEEVDEGGHDEQQIEVGKMEDINLTPDATSNTDLDNEVESPTVKGLGITNLQGHISLAQQQADVAPISPVPSMEVDEPCCHCGRPSPTTSQHSPVTPVTPINHDTHCAVVDEDDLRTQEITRDIGLLNQIFAPGRRASDLKNIRVPELKPSPVSPGKNTLLSPLQTDWFYSPLRHLPPGTADLQAELLRSFKAHHGEPTKPHMGTLWNCARGSTVYDSFTAAREEHELREQEQQALMASPSRTRFGNPRELSRIRHNLTSRRHRFGDGIKKALKRKW